MPLELSGHETDQNEISRSDERIPSTNILNVMFCKILSIIIVLYLTAF